MTVESLLSEVKMVPHLAQQQRLKAGDEAFFGGGGCHGRRVSDIARAKVI